jgi:ABC-type sugar transport system substrate-binding protein
MIRRHAQLTAILIASLILSACTPAFSPPATVTPTAPPVPSRTPRIWSYEELIVAFIQGSSEGWWRAANIASFKDMAAQLFIKLKFYDAQNDLGKQRSAFKNFIADPEVDVIILAPLETTGWDNLLKGAKAAGKIVIIEDTGIDAPEDLYATFVGSDFIDEGRRAAVEMCALLKESEERNVWELAGKADSSIAKDRGQGFREKMGDCGIAIAKSQSGEWSASEGKAVMKTWLKETADVQGLFAQNDEIALGAIEAIKEAGLKPGYDIKIVSIDVSPSALRVMTACELNAAVEFNPLLAPQVYEAALRTLNGEDIPKWIPSFEGIYTWDDVSPCNCTYLFRGRGRCICPPSSHPCQDLEGTPTAEASPKPAP